MFKSCFAKVEDLIKKLIFTQSCEMPGKDNHPPYLLFDLQGPLTIEGNDQPIEDDATVTIVYDNAEGPWEDTTSSLFRDEENDVIQVWVRTPKNKILKDALVFKVPSQELEGKKGNIRIISGVYKNQHGPMDGALLILWDVFLEAEETITFELHPDHPAFVFLFDGELTCGEKTIYKSELAVYETENSKITLTASVQSKFIVIASESYDEPTIVPGPP